MKKRRKTVKVPVAQFATSDSCNRFKGAKLQVINPTKSKTSERAGKDFEEFLYFNSSTGFYTALRDAFEQRG